MRIEKFIKLVTGFNPGVRCGCNPKSTDRRRDKEDDARLK
jgi:hypothetical protein